MACRFSELVLDSRDPGTPAASGRRSSGTRSSAVRLHVDVGPTDRDQDAELARLLALGAPRADVGQSGDESFHVLADPEGDEFCLLRRRLDPL